MTTRFDPNWPSFMEAEFVGDVLVNDAAPAFGFGNLVLDPTVDNTVTVTWHVFGALNPLWLTALSAASPNWMVSAYVDPVGPGAKQRVAELPVSVGAGPHGSDETYTAVLTIPANTLPESNPGDPNQVGVYRLLVTAFLNSDLGGQGFDIIGYAEGPTIMVEDPH